MRFRAVLRQVREKTEPQSHVHRFRAVDIANTRAKNLDTLSCRSFNRELSVDIPTLVEVNWGAWRVYWSKGLLPDDIDNTSCRDVVILNLNWGTKGNHCEGHQLEVTERSKPTSATSLLPSILKATVVEGPGRALRIDQGVNSENLSITASFGNIFPSSGSKWVWMICTWLLMPITSIFPREELIRTLSGPPQWGEVKSHPHLWRRFQKGSEA